MKPQFHEDYVSPRVNPLTQKQADFDYDAVSRALGEEDFDWQDDDLHEKLGQIIRRIFDFCLNVDLNKRNAQALVGRRFIALAWVTNPALFADSPSLIKLSKRLRLSPYPLAIVTGEVTREFGIQNRAQAHAWNRGRKAHTKATAGQSGHDQAQTHKDEAVKLKPEGPTSLTSPRVKESFSKSVQKEGPKQARTRLPH